jgi:hypothetical protein
MKLLDWDEVIEMRCRMDDQYNMSSQFKMGNQYLEWVAHILLPRLHRL